MKGNNKRMKFLLQIIVVKARRKDGFIDTTAFGIFKEKQNKVALL